MGTLKILAFLCMSLSYGFALDLSTCSNAVKDNTCNMTCTTQDFSQIIQILCNGSSVGSCGLVCSTNMHQEGSTITYFSIARLSYQTHLCDWSCAYGSSNSPPSSFTIYSGFPNQLNTTGKKQGNNAVLETIVDCIYPSNPIVKVKYSYQINGHYQPLQDQPVNLRSSSGSCSDSIENKVTATSEVSGDRKEMQGKTVFFKMEFSQSSITSTESTYVSEPIYFEGCDYSDAELFLCGFSLFLIEFVVTIVILSLLKWKKIIGGFTKLKVIVSCAFLLVALIIGIILGVVLLECSKRDLSLGLGLGLGFLLAAAHFVTIYVIHKKDPKMAPPKINVPSRFQEVSTFEKGEPVVIKIPFTSNPKPTVKWVREGVELNGGNYVQEVTEHHAILTIKEANKEDDGRYRLTLENELGTDFAVIKIQVNDDDERKGRKASHVHLVTINGNKVDSQPKEPHRPLPVPPATHPKKLEPLVSVPNDGATSSEKKKKKKKKRKNSEAREDTEDQ